MMNTWYRRSQIHTQDAADTSYIWNYLYNQVPIAKYIFFNEPKIISSIPVLPYTCEKQESSKITSTICLYLHSLLRRGRKAFSQKTISK